LGSKCGSVEFVIRQLEGSICRVSVDGAYETKDCSTTIGERTGRAAVPPRDATATLGSDQPRDAILENITAMDISRGKKDSGCRWRGFAAKLIQRLKRQDNRPRF